MNQQFLNRFLQRISLQELDLYAMEPQDCVYAVLPSSCSSHLCDDKEAKSNVSRR